MNLEHCEIDIDTCDESIMGGGILPYSIIDGEFALLLAQERQVMHWRGSQKWSGFEGGRKPEETVISAISREFQEESLAVCHIGKNSNQYVKINDINNTIHGKKYAMAIGLRVLDDFKKREHITFVVRIDFDKHYQTKFTCIRNQIIGLYKIYEEYNSIKFNNLPDYSNTYDGNYIETIQKVINNGNDRMTVVCKNNYEFEIQLDYDESYIKNMSLKVYLLEMIKKYLNLYPDTKCHPCVDLSNGIHNIKINEDFLEKQAIRYWNYTDLKKVLQNGGFLDEDVFRAYFIPVLQTVVENVDYLKTRPISG